MPKCHRSKDSASENSKSVDLSLFFLIWLGQPGKNNSGSRKICFRVDFFQGRCRPVSISNSVFSTMERACLLDHTWLAQELLQYGIVLLCQPGTTSSPCSTLSEVSSSVNRTLNTLHTQVLLCISKGWVRFFGGE